MDVWISMLLINLTHSNAVDLIYVRMMDLLMQNNHAREAPAHLLILENRKDPS